MKRYKKALFADFSIYFVLSNILPSIFVYQHLIAKSLNKKQFVIDSINSREKFEKSNI